MNKVLIPGSFDPPTKGHLYLIEQSTQLFSFTQVLIAHNPKKKTLLDVEERRSLLEQLTSDFDNVGIDIHQGLVADYARSHNYSALLRGLRNESDFAYELDIANINKGLFEQLTTLFIPTPLHHTVVRSSYVKELLSMGRVMEEFLPPLVSSYLHEKIKDRA